MNTVSYWHGMVMLIKYLSIHQSNQVLCICMGIPDKCFGLIFISIMLEQHYDLSRKETSQASLEFHPFKLLLEIEQPRLHCILLGMTA